LANQLQEEADAKIMALQTAHQEELRQAAASFTGLSQELTALRMAYEQLEAARGNDQGALAASRESFQQEALARHTAQQQVADLKERLSENAAHRQSLEEKHQHAREALEHYRTSVKEQRDQDARRHEQQIQQLQTEIRQLQQTLIIKQEDVTRLNQEGVKLVSDLSHAQKAFQAEESRVYRLEQQLEALRANEHHYQVLVIRLSDKEAQINALLSDLSEKNNQVVASEYRLHALEKELATAQAALEAEKNRTTMFRKIGDSEN
jgi:predicted  nucleic acid-binding Zn-ribbon protein